MPVMYVCPICGKSFRRREVAREHIKREHRDEVIGLVSQLSERRIAGLRKRNIDPENWAAGYILSMMSYGRE